jgi:acyl dehydratase
MATTYATLAELAHKVGQPLGSSDWITVDQARIDAFAAATGDHQWIHTDPVRAAAESPFGTTIAHGFLTLSLLPMLMHQCVAVHAPLKMTINYGLNKLRYPTPVKAGSRVRLHATLASLDDHPLGWQAVWRQEVFLQNEPKPALIAETVLLYVRP